MIAYWAISATTLAIVLRAFLKDRRASKTSLQDWSFVMVAALIWPVTLPFIISHKIKVATTVRHQAKKQTQALQTETDAPVFPM